MPVYNVKLAGDAWVELVATVEAEDHIEAIRKARSEGTWQIVGDVKQVTALTKLNDGESGDKASN